MESPGPTADSCVDAIIAAASQAPAADLIDVRVGQYWVVVRTTVGTGLASAMHSEAHLHGSKPVAAAGELHRRTPQQLTRLLHSDSPPESAIGLAAANALLGPTATSLREEKAVEVLRERGRDKRVAMVGRFPFADRLREDCELLWVFERGINRRGEDLGEEAMDDLLPQADVVAVTATTLANHTLPTIMACVRPDAFVMLLGPSTPLTQTLFQFGFEVLCGTVVDDPETVVRAVEQGAVTSQITGVRRVALWRDE
ncbi:MAG: DUF364 domain-containing protein [Acidobacteria bacterium]|jgi:uncharacterized protein (DUF4213/DUF364 family)|nr:DUF364 domain-containing protein [Acidobacteriota bacterium]